MRQGHIRGKVQRGKRASSTMVKFVDRQVDEVKKLWSNKRQLAFQTLSLAMIIFSALIAWKSLVVITRSESPVVVVLR